MTTHVAHIDHVRIHGVYAVISAGIRDRTEARIRVAGSVATRMRGKIDIRRLMIGSLDALSAVRGASPR
jgi:hypothetical protein